MKHISLETALLAKEKGYNEFTRDVYAETRAHSLYDPRSADNIYFEYKPPRVLNHSYMDSDTKEVCKCPTLGDLHTWVRDNYKFHIEVLLSENAPYDKFYYRITTIGKYFVLSHDDEYFDDADIALETGLRKALTKFNYE